MYDLHCINILPLLHCNHVLLQVAVSPFYRVAVFLYHFIKNPGSKKFRGAYDNTINLDKNISWEIRKRLSWKLWADNVCNVLFASMCTHSHTHTNTHYSVIIKDISHSACYIIYFVTLQMPKLRYSVTEIPSLLVPAQYSEPQYGFVAISNIVSTAMSATICSGV